MHGIIKGPSIKKNNNVIHFIARSLPFLKFNLVPLPLIIFIVNAFGSPM